MTTFQPGDHTTIWVVEPYEEYSEPEPRKVSLHRKEINGTVYHWWINEWGGGYLADNTTFQPVNGDVFLTEAEALQFCIKRELHGYELANRALIKFYNRLMELHREHMGDGKAAKEA